MGIHVIPEAMAPWDALLSNEHKSGQIPLPAVDLITFYDDGPPVITLVAPELGVDHVFVDIENMPPDDRVTLETHLESLRVAAKEIGVAGYLRFVAHAGGLDYDLSGENTITLSDEPAPFQLYVWSLLRSIALIGVRHPDLEHSGIQ
ncbi:MAG TPA: hypothetical protein VFZ25_12020 [Chloroflexota bacterium]|nr:hypothetical protein [Chloroflexota bacterium]